MKNMSYDSRGMRSCKKDITNGERKALREGLQETVSDLS